MIPESLTLGLTLRPSPNSATIKAKLVINGHHISIELLVKTPQLGLNFFSASKLLPIY